MSMKQVGMDRGEFDNRRRIGSVKAAINLYGEGIHEGNSSLKKPQMDFPEKHSSRTRELHLARRDIGRFNESRRVAESVKAQAESELFSTKKTLRDLRSRIDESNLTAKQQMRNMEKLKKPERGNKEWALAVGNIENNQYAEVMRELEYVKQELSKLKLDMASVLEKKMRAERETEASSSKMRSYLSSVVALEKEIEEVNEEQVLVELARIEAFKEFRAIEAQRKKEANQYSSAMEESRKKMIDIMPEIDRAKELESKLAATTSDVNVLQSELMLVKEMDRRVKRNEASFRKGEELDSPSLLFSVTEELEAAKKELASIREEGFQFMASMDIIRNELKHVSEETARLNKTEGKADLTVQNLNSKLLRAKAKLEAASAAEEKAKAIVSNISLTLEQLKTEAEAAKKERELISEEAANIKAEVQKTESEIDLAEERLQAAIQELEDVKSSEAIALENLKNLIDNTMRARASASQHSSTITISTFEYEYLTGHAVGAEEIADKKIAAAQAWIEALKASEREILMKTELAHRKIGELMVAEEQETNRKESSLSAERVVERELKNWKQKSKKNVEAEAAIARKSVNKSGNSTPARRAKFRKSASPAVRLMPRSTSYTIRRRKKLMPNLAKFFSSKRIERDV
uniref:Protein PLASTID MOVEMENT IMPAIRED 2 n=1 Tax=Davidia involucrata TaxID=16924 RepID=A0A5B7AMA1_DAVIN